MVLLSSAGLLLTSYGHLHARDGVNGAISPELVGWALFASSILLALVPMEVALILGRLPGTHAAGLHLQTTSTLPMRGDCRVHASCSCRIPRRSGLVARFLPLGLAIGQIGASFLVFDAYPARLLVAGWHCQRLSCPRMLLLSSWRCWSSGRYSMWLCGFESLPARWLWKLSRCCSPPLPCSWLWRPPRRALRYLRILDPDDYHIGEHLVESWAYLKGLVPYVDYLPPHGLVDDDLAGMLGSFFFDGTAAPLAEASRLAFWLLAFITALCGASILW